MAKNKIKYSDKQRQGATLLSALANGSTEQAREIIKERLGFDAKDSKDLQHKLAQLYSTTTDKAELEKVFANIHPHKDFILKYFPPLKTQIIAPNNEIKELPISNEQIKEIEKEATSNCNGDVNCVECAEKLYNASGDEAVISNGLNPNVAVIGIISIVGLIALGMIVISKQQK
jgi:hypothetical protein